MEVTLAVLCDYAFRSDVGKLNILGVFEELMPAMLPVVHPQMYLVVSYEASAAEVGQQKHIRTTLLEEDGSEVLSLEVGTTVQQPVRPGIPVHLNSVFGLSQVQFTNPGDYAFHILIGGEEKRRVPLHVYPPPQPSPGGSNV